MDFKERTQYSGVHVESGHAVPEIINLKTQVWGLPCVV